MDIPRRLFLSSMLLLPFVGRSARAKPIVKRIVVLDWAAAESLLALGVQPVGVGDADRFRQWFPEAGLGSETVDLGPSNEPNLEMLYELSPELIFIPDWAIFNKARLETIAPVKVVEIYNGNRQPIDNATAFLREVAGVVKKVSEAIAYINGADEIFADIRAKVASSANRPIFVAVLSEDARHATVYGKGSLVQNVMDRIGLSNAWTGTTSPWGNAVIGLEEFVSNHEVRILYLDQGERTKRALHSLEQSSLWKGIPAVANRQTFPIPAFYPSAGLPTAIRLARLLASLQ